MGQNIFDFSLAFFFPCYLGLSSFTASVDSSYRQCEEVKGLCISRDTQAFSEEVIWPGPGLQCFLKGRWMDEWQDAAARGLWWFLFFMQVFFLPPSFSCGLFFFFSSTLDLSMAFLLLAPPLEWCCSYHFTVGDSWSFFLHMFDLQTCFKWVLHPSWGSQFWAKSWLCISMFTRSIRRTDWLVHPPVFTVVSRLLCDHSCKEKPLCFQLWSAPRFVSVKWERAGLQLPARDWFGLLV